MQRKPLWWWLVGIILLEVLARWITPFNDVLVASDVPRNPMARFGWPEYTQHKVEEDEELIVIISNSQGESRELDASEIYMAHLQKMAKKKAPHLRFENWSIGGIKAVDIEILTRKAILNGASKVWVIASNYAFLHDSSATPDATVNDVGLLDAPFSQTKFFDHTLYSEQGSAEDRFKRKLFYYSDLVRLRTPATMLWKKWTNSKYQIFFYGKYLDRKAANYTGIIENKPFFLNDPKALNGVEQQAVLCTEVFNRIQKDKVRFGWETEVSYFFLPRPELKTIYSVPLNKNIDRKPYLEAEDSFMKYVKPEFEKSQITFLDWRNVVPDKYFGKVASFHFNSSGHRYFANYLFDRAQE